MPVTVRLGVCHWQCLLLVVLLGTAHWQSALQVQVAVPSRFPIASDSGELASEVAVTGTAVPQAAFVRVYDYYFY